MKYLKITILEPAGSQMVYPANYQLELGNFAVDHLYFDEAPADNQSELLLAIPDKDFNVSMVRDRVVEITEAEANTISITYETKTETVLDEAKLRRLELKARLGMVLTKEEEDAVDPLKPNSIFGTSETFVDRTTKLKTKGL